MTDAQVFKDFSPSELNFPKFHAPVHFQLYILLFGRLENLDTETLEQFHHFSAQLPIDNSTKLKDKATQKVFLFSFSLFLFLFLFFNFFLLFIYIFYIFFLFFSGRDIK